MSEEPAEILSHVPLVAGDRNELTTKNISRKIVVVKKHFPLSENNFLSILSFTKNFSLEKKLIRKAFANVGRWRRIKIDSSYVIIMKLN